MNKKGMLGFLGIGVVLTTMAVLIYAQSISRDNHANTQRLKGAYFVTVTPDSRALAPFPALGMFTEDGGIWGASPSHFDSTGFGEWVRTGDREFSFVLVGFNHSPEGPVVSTTALRIGIKLSEDASEFNGAGTFEIVGLKGDTINSFRASVHGQRIRVGSR